MSERVGAIVLAGGRSARFGRDKLAEPVHGRPLLDLAVAAVQAMSSESDVVVVVASADDRRLPAGVRRIEDALRHAGPLAGVVTGLGSLPGSVDRVIVVGGDMPRMVPAVLDRLVSELVDGVDAAWLIGPDGPRPLPLAVRRGPALERATALLATGERRLRALPSSLGAVGVPAATWRALDPEGATLRDVDVPADL